MEFKCIFFTFVFCMNLIRNYGVQSHIVDIVLEYNYSNQNYYKRFINVTQQQFVWLSTVLCDNNTYSYSITYDKDNGSVVSNSSSTFRAQNVDPDIHVKEFTCSSASTAFQCTRSLNNQNFDDINISWMYLSTDTSSTCPDKCVTMCTFYPIQSILFTYDKQNFKFPNNAECKNAIPYQTSTLKSQPNLTLQSNLTSKSTLKPPSTLTSQSNSMPTYTSPLFQNNSKNTSPYHSLPVIIGASIGGGALIIILIILFFVCLKWRRKRTRLKTLQLQKHSFDNTKENCINTKKQQNHTDKGDHKTHKTDSAKAKFQKKLTTHVDITDTCGNNNWNVDLASYSCVESDGMEALEKDNNVYTINTDQRQCQPSEFSNPAFSGSGVDYSSINEVHNESNNNANNNDDLYSNEPSHNSGNTYFTLGQNTRSLLADTYSTLGEKTRSVSDTYNVMPTVSNKKGHKSLGAISDYHNNSGNASNGNLSDSIGQVYDTSNDVYAQVIKPMRKVNGKE